MNLNVPRKNVTSSIAGSASVRKASMMRRNDTNEYDAVVVGSGTCGATIAMELCKRKKKVVILEKGTNAEIRETFVGIASAADEVPVGDGIKAARAITTGGSTSLYFGVATLPPLDAFLSLGIDLSGELEEVRRELPLAELPDRLLGVQTKRLRESAIAMGHQWKKNLMLIDERKCDDGYSYEAKWKARGSVEQAVRMGAKLITGAAAHKIIIHNNKAVGVEYRKRRVFRGYEIRRIYGAKIILSAGSLSSPMILRDSGITDVANRGFYYDPAFALFGIVPGMKGRDVFVGSMSTDYVDDIALGDGNMTRTLYQMLMLSNFRIGRVFSFSETMAVAVKLKDGMGGELRDDGRYYKQLNKEETDKLKKGESEAEKILKNAGAKRIIKGRLVAGNPGGVVRIHEHVDEKLETKYANLHVCDASVLSEDMRVTPALTLVCLGKYLAKQLLPAL